MSAQARAGDPALEAMAGGAGSAIGLGGMLTKVLAAKRAARSGAHTVIASGREENVLLRLAARRGDRHAAHRRARRRSPRASNGSPTICRCADSSCSTRARSKRSRSTARACCRSACTKRSANSSAAKSVSCLDEARREIARGLVNYSAAETRRILRTPSAEIEAKLGYVDEPELIHRDNLVLL